LDFGQELEQNKALPHGLPLLFCRSFFAGKSLGELGNGLQFCVCVDAGGHNNIETQSRVPRDAQPFLVPGSRTVKKIAALT
jgi:hypothetical protein